MNEQFINGVPRIDIEKLNEFRENESNYSLYNDVDITNFTSLHKKVLATMLHLHFKGPKTPHENVVDEFARILNFLEEDGSLDDYYLKITIK